MHPSFPTRAPWALTLTAALMLAATGAQAQSKDLSQPKVSSGNNTLDLLLDLAASAPPSGREKDRSELPGTRTKDARERMTESLKETPIGAKEAGPVPGANVKTDAIPRVDAVDMAVIAGQGARSEASSEQVEQSIKQQLESSSGAPRPARALPEDRLHIPEDSWIRSVAYWVRDHRYWIAGVGGIGLVILWIASALFSAARGSGSGGSASGGGATWAPPKTVTRATPRRPRSRR